MVMYSIESAWFWVYQPSSLRHSRPGAYRPSRPPVSKLVLSHLILSFLWMLSPLLPGPQPLHRLPVPMGVPPPSACFGSCLATAPLFRLGLLSIISLASFSSSSPSMWLETFSEYPAMQLQLPKAGKICFSVLIFSRTISFFLDKSSLN